MDHQLVMSTVTHGVVSQDGAKTPDLYYYGMPASQLSGESRMLRGVQDEHLTTRIPFSDDHYETALESLACHASQIPPESLECRREAWAERENLVYLRPFVAPSGRSDDLFDNERAVPSTPVRRPAERCRRGGLQCCRSAAPCPSHVGRSARR